MNKHDGYVTFSRGPKTCDDTKALASDIEIAVRCKGCDGIHEPEPEQPTSGPEVLKPCEHCGRVGPHASCTPEAPKLAGPDDLPDDPVPTVEACEGCGGILGRHTTTCHLRDVVTTTITFPTIEAHQERIKELELTIRETHGLLYQALHGLESIIK